MFKTTITGINPALQAPGLMNMYSSKWQIKEVTKVLRF
jgi:hypothetical protein